MAGTASTTEREAMVRAISLARTPTLPTHPNPRVGAVLLDANGAEVGSGFHAGAGSPHAEVEALAQAGELARGATAIVTLEPCNHTGRTGPCSAALIDAGVARVVYGQPDPNPLARGGADALTAAGHRRRRWCAGRGSAFAEPCLVFRDRAPAPTRHVEVRSDLGRPSCGSRQHQSMDQWCGVARRSASPPCGGGCSRRRYRHSPSR